MGPSCMLEKGGCGGSCNIAYGCEGWVIFFAIMFWYSLLDLGEVGSSLIFRFTLVSDYK